MALDIWTKSRGHTVRWLRGRPEHTKAQTRQRWPAGKRPNSEMRRRRFLVIVWCNVSHGPGRDRFTLRLIVLALRLPTRRARGAASMLSCSLDDSEHEAGAESR